jgi:acetyl/propionyl-CoA carboxylase alpha subunit
MGAVAVAAAQAANYTSAGTVEFLLDSEGNFYFLEVNTRLQVEHPVTELVTGIDLVLEQFRVASGRPLRLRQEDVTLRGHAIECRIAAEDPFNSFVPSLGTVADLSEPGGPGVRVDSGLFRGGKVTVYYDPMVAKLIVWAPTRAHAILRMRRALEEYRIVGVQTNIPFHLAVLDSIDFQRGRLDTNFVERFTGMQRPTDSVSSQLEEVTAAAAALVLERRRQAGSVNVNSNGRVPTGDGERWRDAGRRAGLR